MVSILSRTEAETQANLKDLLQGEASASMLENLAAALLGRLLNVPIAIAKSGFQHGGDAGPAGRQGRRFRIESKRYSDSTSLSQRELLGEIDHALLRDDALEAWVLVATRNVSEQLELDLTQKGDGIGVPVVIFDWKDHGLSSLAALCASAPDIVEEVFSPSAGALARMLQPVATDAIEQIRLNLQSWNLGFETLRAQSHTKLLGLWNSPKQSNAELGQDAAGGAQPKKVKRARIQTTFTTWWLDKEKTYAPLAVIGWDGVGKTWATLDWMVEHCDEQPITLVVPSSSAAELTKVSETTVKRFLADRLYELGGRRDRAHWLRRLDYLLNRPPDEGPVITIFFDGLNQEPSVLWIPLLKVLQGSTFESRIRVIISTRNHHWTDRLSNLRGLVVPPVLVNVDLYDTSPGGELDQMLAFEGLSQANLPADLIELARRPRLFKLVLHLKERFVEAGQVTIHRLLWEYGRDTFGERAGRSFSEDEWRDWLREIARTYREGVREYSIKSLGETATRADLTAGEVFARLSDIIDGRFVEPGPSGGLRLSETVVSHALGAALLSHLAGWPVQTYDAIDIELSKWLDPIAGLDQRAEILRAAVSILIERGTPTATPIMGALVTQWLQTQNVTDQHRRELAALAGLLPVPLLDAVEHSSQAVHASARQWAVHALRAISRSDTAVLIALVQRIKAWFYVVSRDIDSRSDANFEKHRAERLIRRVGIDASGSLTVLGLPLMFVDQDDGNLGQMVASILEGFPLAFAMPVFEAAAVSFSVAERNRGWDALKWLCLFNEADNKETTAALRNLSNNVCQRVPEFGIHANLPARAAALLLWLTGFEADEESANRIDPGIDHWLSYEKDYLVNPGQSFFALERRHAEAVLLDTSLTLHSRSQKVQEMLLDPTFELPLAFIAEVRAAAAVVDVEKLNCHNSYTVEDHAFEQFEPFIARCAPDLVIDIARRKLQSFRTCPPVSRYWKAIHATDQFVALDGTEVGPAQILRQSATESRDADEAFAVVKLMTLEIRELSAMEQFIALINADLKFISVNIGKILKELTCIEVDALIVRFREAGTKQQQDLLGLLSLHPGSINGSVWDLAEKFARADDEEGRGLAFKTLACADEIRFGKRLIEWNWCWSPEEKHFWTNHFGSGALIEATLAVPFDQIVLKLAPWRLLEAVRRRGANPVEVQMAGEIFGKILAAEKLEEIDPGSTLLIDRTNGYQDPLVFSIQLRTSEEDAKNPSAAFRKAMDAEEQLKAYRRASHTATQRICEARRAGADLYLANVAIEDFEPVIKHCPELLDAWLIGMNEQTENFRRCVRLAEAVYLSLCEALLSHDPERGVVLWRALRAVLITRFLGAADIDEMIHIAFRTGDSPTIAAVRDELFDLNGCNTDEALYELAIAATFNGKADWLMTRIAIDEVSPYAWRQKRAIVLSGFLSNSKLPIAGAWPDGPPASSYEELKRTSTQSLSIEACARHWWKVFCSTQDQAEAYAAWILFLRSADRRAYIWLRDSLETTGHVDSLSNLKLIHLELNQQAMKREIKKRPKDINKHFLGRRISEEVGPWIDDELKFSVA